MITKVASLTSGRRAPSTYTQRFSLIEIRTHISIRRR